MSLCTGYLPRRYEYTSFQRCSKTGLNLLVLPTISFCFTLLGFKDLVFSAFLCVEGKFVKFMNLLSLPDSVYNLSSCPVLSSFVTRRNCLKFNCSSLFSLNDLSFTNAPESQYSKHIDLFQIWTIGIGMRRWQVELHSHLLLQKHVKIVYVSWILLHSRGMDW